VRQLEYHFNFISETFAIPLITLINIDTLGYIICVVIRNGIIFNVQKGLPDEKILFEPKITSDLLGG
jgi:hypothetical protein